MSDFWDSEGAEWHQTPRGNYVRIIDDELTATVFERGAGWSGVSNLFEGARFTRRQRDTPEAAAELLLEAEEEGEDSGLWSPPSSTDWQESKPKGGRPGFHCKRDGVPLAVRQCEPRGGYPPSWLAFTGMGNQVLASNGKPWFRSAAEAMMAAEAASTPQGDDDGY